MSRSNVRVLQMLLMLGYFGVATAAPPGDRTFLQEAIEGNLGEIRAGALAQQKASSQAVKDFGATLEKDHTAANQKATEAAATMKQTVPKAPGAEHHKMYKKLASLSGWQFDKEFIQGMIEDHQKDIQKYTEEANKHDAEASAYAREVLPDLQKHLQIAQRIQGELR